MAYVPQYFQASTYEVAEKALEKGLLKFPSLCYVSATQTLYWLDESGTSLKEVGAAYQITNVTCDDGKLTFYRNSDVLYSVDVELSAEDTDDLINKVKSGIVLDYEELSNVPVTVLKGTTDNPVELIKQADGAYRVLGEYIIGGDLSVVQTSDGEAIFFVQSTDDNISVTRVKGQTIQLYNVALDGTYESSNYITDKWVEDKDYMATADVKSYVQENMNQVLLDTIQDKPLTESEITALFEDTGDDDGGSEKFTDIDLYKYVCGKEVGSVADAVWSGYTNVGASGSIHSLMFAGATMSNAVVKSDGIPEYAFKNCTNLKTVTYSGGSDRYTTIETGAFDGCLSLEMFEEKGKYSEWDDGYENNGVCISYDCFSGCNSLKTVSTLRVTEIKDQAFYYCTALTVITLPLVETIGKQVFSGTGIKRLYLPSLTEIKSKYISDGMFYNDVGGYVISEIIVPKATSIGDYAFYDCSSLVRIDSSATSIGYKSFFNCTSLVVVILRDTTTVCTVESSMDPLFSNDSVYIYVPSTLLDSYKSDTNWSAYASKFRALEDYTVDGTTTGYFDETKI